MEQTYILIGENIYYLDNSNYIIGIEFFNNTIIDGFKKNRKIFKPILDSINNIIIEGATPEESQHYQQLEQQKLLKQQQYEELLPTDWYVIRFLERGIPIPEEITQQRQAILDKYNT